jgi:hypothetical protein
MFKTLILVECNQCGSTFSEIISQVNNREVPFFRLDDLLISLVNAGWLSHRSASIHTCYDCQHPDNISQEDLEASCPF